MNNKTGKHLEIVVVTDMEGISGIDEVHQILYGYKEFEEFGRTQITEDVNAAVRGLRAAGATGVKVVDTHGSGGQSTNIIRENLEKNVKLDAPRALLMEALDKPAAGAVLIGFHAMADTKDGFLSHTVTLEPRVKINGKPVGETGLTALVLAHYGVPVIMATGDQALVEEASALLPGVETVQVKTSLNRRTTECLPPPEARRLIEKSAARALSRVGEFRPLQVEKPIRVEISFPTKEHADLAETVPRAKRTAEKTLSYVAENGVEAEKFIRTTISLATQLRMSSLMQELSKLEGFKKIRKRFFEKLVERWVSEQN